MEAALGFYRRFGLNVEADPGNFHAAAHLPNGMLIERDSTEFVSQWDTGWKQRPRVRHGHRGRPATTVVGATVPSAVRPPHLADTRTKRFFGRQAVHGADVPARARLEWISTQNSSPPGAGLGVPEPTFSATPRSS